MTRIIRIVRLAMKSLLLHKLRSGLTMLGIVFGVFSVIAMLAIGEGASAQAQKQVLELGATNVIVRSIKPPDEVAQTSSSARVLQYGLLRSDYKILTETLPTIVNAAPIREVDREVRFLKEAMNARVVGCTAEYMGMNHLDLAAGRFLTASDQNKLLNVAVVANEVANKLFKYENPLGQSIRIGPMFYTVVGVTKDRTASAAIGGSLSGQDYNKDVYIPIKTLQAREGDLDIKRQAGSMTAEHIELNQITLRVSDKDTVLPTAQAIRETLEQSHPRNKDYAVVVPLELLKQAEQIRMIFNVVLGSIAAISLVVGGIGIMNIMLATVTERTREIGVRRALGARQRDIIEQFLTETIVLAGSGGLIGVAFGLLTPVTFLGIQWFVQNFVMEGGTAGSDVGRMFFDLQPQIAFWSLPVAFGISVTIGILSGIYPAISAAKLDPIEALRHE
ncbi:MAG: ABC transporter ATP-binding protein [Gimesia sp.]|uniref:Macrolide export ATP-binding/permease protein MacB n=1 Tax=Gimesia chilikensis TaxID=2605989 RepID=A0A517PV10_9PLAN|nr:ABC transporter permease [Gimesia chilikensis]MBN68508.1 ABC transporter ATP-binding protein [Gimesia sp.]MCR9230517.1 ABC transporter permease [bacterium]QDT23205.1 Macrolide export ATP-binding/permease protein MacB [Gimesia chilikensis]